MNINEINRSIRTKDKLDYRIVLQRKVESCLDALGTSNLSRTVKALRTGVYFDVPGLPFKHAIKEKEKELKGVYGEKIKQLIIMKGRDEWIHPVKREINNLSFIDSYYTDLLEFLLDLLAQHDALIMSKDYVETGEM